MVLILPNRDGMVSDNEPNHKKASAPKSKWGRGPMPRPWHAEPGRSCCDAGQAPVPLMPSRSKSVMPVRRSASG
jgi:hypothetical protein